MKRQGCLVYNEALGRMDINWNCKNIKIQGERQQPSWLLPLVLFMQPYREAVLPHCRAEYIPGDIPW